MGFQRYNGQDANRKKDTKVPNDIHVTANSPRTKLGVIARGSNVPVVKNVRGGK